MGVANLSRRQFLAGSAAAGVSLSLDNLVLGQPVKSIPADFLAMVAALKSLQDKREKVPAESDLKEAETALQKLFEAQYKARKPEFADNLLSGAATEEKTSKRYVMLRDSAQISAENFKLPNSFAALEKLTETYQVKLDTLAGDVLKTAKKGAKSPQQNAEFAELGMSIADLGIKWNEYEAAMKAVNEAKSVAGKSGDKSLVDKTNEKLKEVTLLKKEFDEYVNAEKARAGIKIEDTSDPKKKADYEKFSLIIGKWECFKEDKWNVGIYTLPLGSDRDLASIAVKEQKLFENTVPFTAENCFDLAEAWYAKTTKKENDPRDKARYGSRASYWYDKTLETATGALKSAAETKIKELGAFAVAGRTIVDLLKMIDVKKDAVAGKWELKDGKLTSDNNTKWARLQIPYDPPNEYNLKIVASSEKAGNALVIGLVVGDNQFAAVLDSMDGATSGLGWIDGLPSNANQTTYKGKIFTDEKPRTILCEVRKERVSIYVDGKTLINWQGDYKRLSLSPDLAVPNKKALSIGSNMANYNISQIFLTPTSGSKSR